MEKLAGISFVKARGLLDWTASLIVAESLGATLLENKNHPPVMQLASQSRAEQINKIMYYAFLKFMHSGSIFLHREYVYCIVQHTLEKTVYC